MPVFPVCAWQDADGHTATNAADTVGDTEGLQFDTDGTCTWNANGLNVGVGAGVQSVDNIGTTGVPVLTFGLGITCGVDGTIGESGATLGTMNVYDGLITLGVADGNHHFIDLIAFKADGELEVTNDNNIWGYVTTSTDGFGTLDFNGTTAVSGTVGTSSRALKNIEAGDTGETVTFGGDTYADLVDIAGDGQVDFNGALTNNDHTTSINFNGDATLNVTGAFSGDQIAVGANAATLTFSNNAMFNDYTAGPGASVATFDALIFGDSIVLGAGATVNLNAGFWLTTGILAAGDGQGTVNINSSEIVAQDIAADAAKLAALTVSGCSLITGNNIYADTFTITGNGSSLSLAGNVLLKGDTLITLNAGDTATLDVGPCTLTCDSAAFALNASNILSLDLTGLGTSGKVDITNIADDGASVSAAAAIEVDTNGQYVADGQVFTVIDADNAHAGGAGYAAPGTVTDNSALLAFTSGTANGGQDIIITASRTTTYDAIGGNRNSSAAGAALEAAGQGSPSADMQVVLGALDALDKAIAISQALDQVYPSPDAAAVVEVNVAVNQALNTVLSHIGSTRSAASMGQGDAGPFGLKTGLWHGDADLFYDDPFEGAAVWARGFGAYDHQKDHDAIRGYDSYMGGLSLGVDAKREGNLLLGAGGGFARTQVDADHAAGTDTDILTFLGSLYCGYDGTLDSIEGVGLYAEAVGTIAWNMYDSSRLVRFGGLDRTATADYGGQEYCVYGEAGYVFYHEGFQIVPLASLRYAHIGIEDFEETGAGALNLKVDDQGYDYLESGLGVKIAYPMEVESWRLLPEIRLKWLYEYIGDEIEITSRFTAGGPSFKTTGLGSPRSTIAIGGALTVFTRHNLTLSLDYDFAGKENYFSNNASLTLKYQF